MPGSILALAYTMRSIGIGHQGKEFVVPDQLVDENFGILIMNIIIPCSVGYQQVTLKLMGKINGRAIFIALWIFLG